VKEATMHGITFDCQQLKYDSDKGTLIITARGHFSDVASEAHNLATTIFGNQRWWFVHISGHMPDSAIIPSSMEWRIEAILEENR
jgi:hypothetical protein